MPLRDLLAFVLDLHAPEADAARPEGQGRDEQPLRYEVESMQHWIDLNA